MTSSKLFLPICRSRLESRWTYLCSPHLRLELLDTPLQVDPGTQLRQVSFRFFHFDPTFAPAGKTAGHLLFANAEFRVLGASAAT